MIGSLRRLKAANLRALAGSGRRVLCSAATGQAELAAEEISLTERAASLSVRLTQDEISLLAKQAGGHGQDLRVTRAKFLTWSRQMSEREMEREAFLAAIEEPAREQSALGRWFFPVISVVGTASYAIAGTQVAGEAGMNIVGCTFVGGVSSMGGGTVNSLLYGYGKHGVPWVVEPRHLMIALVSSIGTFTLWPIMCRYLAEERIRSIQDLAKSRNWWASTMDRIRFAKRVEDGITRSEWLYACEDEAFYKQVRKALATQAKAKIPGVAEPSPSQLFDLIDLDGNGVLDVAELQRLVLLEHQGSTVRYMIDTVALSTSSVHSAASAISRGLHPVVCAVAGVTVCFGGIIRDLICNRDVALATQSFAASTAAGATVYVALRELCLRGWALPLKVRAMFAMSTTIAVRVADFYADGALLPPMHGRPPAADSGHEERFEPKEEMRSDVSGKAPDASQFP